MTTLLFNSAKVHVDEQLTRHALSNESGTNTRGEGTENAKGFDKLRDAVVVVSMHRVVLGGCRLLFI